MAALISLSVLLEVNVGKSAGAWVWCFLVLLPSHAMSFDSIVIKWRAKLVRREGNLEWKNWQCCSDAVNSTDAPLLQVPSENLRFWLPLIKKKMGPLAFPQDKFRQVAFRESPPPILGAKYKCPLRAFNRLNGVMEEVSLAPCLK